MKRAGLMVVLLCFLLTACDVPAADVSPEVPKETEQEEVQPPAQEAEKELVVYTDWSKLEPKEEALPPVGSQWYEETPQELLPNSEYGPLVPYAGIRLLDDWPAESGCMYGLMTPDGTVVTAPVYSGVHQPGGYDASGVWQPFPLLVLKRGDAERVAGEKDPMVCAVAAVDGSWCMPFDYQAYSVSVEGVLLFGDESLSVMDPDGTIRKVWTVETMGITQQEFQSLLSDVTWGDGWGGQRRGDRMALGWEADSDYERIRTFDFVTGEIASFSIQEWDQLAGAPVWPEHPEPAVENADFVMDCFGWNSAPYLLVARDYREDGMTITYYREDGTPIPQFTRYGERWDERLSLVGGLIEVLETNMVSYYDLDTMECVFRTYLSYEGD